MLALTITAVEGYSVLDRFPEGTILESFNGLQMISGRGAQRRVDLTRLNQARQKASLAMTNLLASPPLDSDKIAWLTSEIAILDHSIALERQEKIFTRALFAVVFIAILGFPKLFGPSS